MLIKIVRWFTVLFFASSAYSFNLRPETELDDEILVLKESSFSSWGFPGSIRLVVRHFSEPVHEIITNKAWGCTQNAIVDKAGKDECRPHSGNKNMAPSALLAGVQWNDNPYFQLVETSLDDCRDKTIWLPVMEPQCWWSVFKKGEKDARSGNPPKLGDVILLRSHFGDMQFLHSMRSSKQETAEQTRTKILMWAEFVWNAAIGKYERGTTVEAVTAPGLAAYFSSGETMQRIFFRGNPTYVNEFPLFAFGTLLHMVEDSFSKSHVKRESEGADGSKCPNSNYYRPARIISFQNYAEQEASVHAQDDSYIAMNRAAIHDSPNVIEVISTLKELFDRKAEWKPEVESYMRCIYDLKT